MQISIIRLPFHITLLVSLLIFSPSLPVSLRFRFRFPFLPSFLPFFAFLYLKKKLTPFFLFNLHLTTFFPPINFPSSFFDVAR